MFRELTRVRVLSWIFDSVGIITQQETCTRTYRLARAFTILANTARSSFALDQAAWRCGLPLSEDRRNKNYIDKNKNKNLESKQQAKRKKSRFSIKARCKANLLIMQAQPWHTLIPTLVSNNSVKRAAKLRVRPRLSALEAA